MLNLICIYINIDKKTQVYILLNVYIYNFLKFDDLVLHVLYLTYQNIIQNKILCLPFVLVIE